MAASNVLRLEVLLAAIDKATGPLRRIAGGGTQLSRVLRESQSQLKKLEAQQASLAKHRALEIQTGRTSQQLVAQRRELQAMQAAYNAAESPTAKMTAALRRQSEAVGKLARAEQSQRSALTQSRSALAAAGLGTERLAVHESRLSREISQANRQIEQQQRQLARLAKTQEMARRAHSGGMTAAAHGAGLTAAGGLALQRAGSTMQPGMAFEAQMRDIRITGGFNAAQEAALANQIRADALTYVQTTDKIGAGLSVLVANGISDAKALGMYSGLLAKKSVASGAEVEDLSNTIVSLTKNLDIAAKDVGGAIDSLAYSGKQGSFELRDMAKWMPQLSPMMAALGVKGRGAVDELGAALQVARLGAGTSDEAANNLRNYLAKIVSPDTLQNFDKAGIDLKRRLLELQAQGVTPLQGSLRVITEYMGKKGPEATRELRDALKIKDDEQRQQALDQLAQAYALGDLFRDQQAMAFIRPALMNDGKMQTIRQGASKADGVLDADWISRVDVAQARVDRFKIAINEFKLQAFDLLKVSLGDWADRLSGAMMRMMAFSKAHPALTAGLLKLGVAVSIAAVVLGGLLVAGGTAAMMLANILRLAELLSSGRGLGWLAGRGAQLVPQFFGAIVNGARMAIFALSGVSAPVLLVGALVASLALLIWKYWQPIRALLVGVGQGFMEALLPVWRELQGALAPLAPVIDALSRGFGVVWRFLVDMVTPFQATNAQLQAATGYGRTFGAVLGALIGGSLRGFISLIGTLARGLRIAFDWSPAVLIYRNWSTITSMVRAIVGGVTAYLRGAWMVVTGIFGGDTGRIRAGLQTMWGVVNSSLSGWPGRLLQFGQNMVQGMIDGIRSKATAVGTALGNIAGGAVAKVKSALGIQSPSRVFAALGGYTMDGFTQGLLGGQGGAHSALQRIGAGLRATGAGIALGAASTTVAAAALPDLPALQSRIDSRPPLNAGAGAGSVRVVEHRTYEININAAGGDQDAIARAVRQAIQDLENERRVRGRAALTDYDE